MEHATLSPSGFCEDRRIVGDLYDTIRAGTVPYRQAAASAAAVGKLMRANAELAPTDRGALKLRQFALYLNTLRLALMGAAANYPDDYAVKQFTNGLVNRVADISAEFDCPSRLAVAARDTYSPVPEERRTMVHGKAGGCSHRARTSGGSRCRCIVHRSPLVSRSSCSSQ